METITHKHIDLTYLKQLSNGSNEFINEMISVFMEQTPIEISNLEKYLEAKDWKSLRAIAHKMKPSFSFMGMKELDSLIKSIEENAANETNLDLLPGMIIKLKNTCYEAMKELEIEQKSFL
ncbi:MAG: Hpt domain-containing protein [Bacteroidota bacterium]